MKEAIVPVDSNLSQIALASVEHIEGHGGLLTRVILDEGKTTGLLSPLVESNYESLDWRYRAKILVDAVVLSEKAQIANVESG